MSKRGREKKKLHVDRVTAKRADRKKAREERLQPRNKAALGMMPPWKRKIVEALKKRDKKRGL